MNHHSTIQAAIAGILALGVAATAFAGPVTPKANQEKCYGIAKAGQNDCGTAKHVPQSAIAHSHSIVLGGLLEIS